MPHDYDLVIGPTADDDTALCLKTYWDGLYGRRGERRSKEILLTILSLKILVYSILLESKKWQINS